MREGQKERVERFIGSLDFMIGEEIGRLVILVSLKGACKVGKISLPV